MFKNNNQSISSNYVDSKEKANARQYEISIKDTKGVLDILSGIKIDEGFTLEETNSRILLNKFEWTDTDKFLKDVASLLEKLGDNYDGTKEAFIQSRYIQGVARRRTYEAWLETNRESNGNNRVIRYYIEQAYEKLKQRSSEIKNNSDKYSLRYDEELETYTNELEEFVKDILNQDFITHNVFCEHNSLFDGINMHISLSIECNLLIKGVFFDFWINKD